MPRLKIVICGRQVDEAVPVIASMELRQTRSRWLEVVGDIGAWLSMEQDEKSKFRFERSGPELWHVFLGENGQGVKLEMFPDELAVAGEICRAIIERMVG